MFNLRADLHTNRLQISLHGSLSLEEFVVGVDQAIAAAEAMVPGYTVEMEGFDFKLPGKNKGQIERLLRSFRLTKASEVTLVGERGLRVPESRSTTDAKIPTVELKWIRLPR